MTWVRIALVALGLVEGAWMTFDGTRALKVGDYVTPSSGAHAGQLGPWNYVVRAVGIPPRSTAMKVIFVVYGLSWLVIAIGVGSTSRDTSCRATPQSVCCTVRPAFRQLGRGKTASRFPSTRRTIVSRVHTETPSSQPVAKLSDIGRSALGRGVDGPLPSIDGCRCSQLRIPRAVPPRVTRSLKTRWYSLRRQSPVGFGRSGTSVSKLEVMRFGGRSRPRTRSLAQTSS
jgi:hypothetical protein